MSCVQSDKYCVNAEVIKKDVELIANAYGIYNAESFAALMAKHLCDPREAVFVPCHILGSFWRNRTVDNNLNESHVINQGETEKEKQAAKEYRGYYTILVRKLVPDYLRYFKRYGVRVSGEFTEREFHSFMDRSEKMGRYLPLKVVDGKGANMPSVRELMPEQLSADVISMGRGHKLRHGITCGNAISLLDGSRDFYVLTSHCPTSEEVDTFYRGENGPLADDWISTLRQTPGFEFWIFAVSKKAALTTHTNYSRAKLPPLTAPPVPPPQDNTNNSSTKRERDEHDVTDDQRGQPRARQSEEDEDEYED